jgi:sarcosine oxidase subunit alpha
VGRGKRDFVGKRSLARAEMRRPDRRQLVGLVPVDGRSQPEDGAQLLAAAGGAPLGQITSAYPPATFAHPIALGLLAAGRVRIGGEVLALGPEGPPMALRVVDPVFHDKAGTRLDG